MHTEKQEIFDRYAESKGYESFYEIVHDYVYMSDPKEIINHALAACDLVQKEQQKRIAENARTTDISNVHSFKGVDKSSILSEKNLIK